MEEMMQWNSYEEYEKAFDQIYKSTVDNYILMGYMLRKAQDTDILYNSGYGTVAEFAWNRYKIKPDTVSRMMSVNKRFSEGGYSPRLEERYEGYAATVLAEMLQLPDAIVEALPSGTTREEVRSLKAECREEKKITPLELTMENRKEGGLQPEDSFGEFIKEYYRANPEEYIAIQPKIIKATQNTLERMAEDLLCPSGQATMTARVPGKGRYMLAVKGRGQDVKLVNMRTEETEICAFSHLTKLVARICMTGKYGDSPEQAWERLTGETYVDQKEKASGSRNEESGIREEEKTDASGGKEIQSSGEEIKKKSEVQVNTGKEQDNADTGNGDDQADDNGEEKGNNQEESEQDITQQDAEKQELAPAQPEQREQDKDDEVEVIENPYREYLDDVNVCLRQIRELLDDENYKMAYQVGRSLVSALNDMCEIQKGRDEQIAGQMELENYTEQ